MRKKKQKRKAKLSLRESERRRAQSKIDTEDIDVGWSEGSFDLSPTALDIPSLDLGAYSDPSDTKTMVALYPQDDVISAAFLSARLRRLGLKP
jgi:hypothetical protein